MLRPGAAVAIPAVVGDIHQHIRSAQDKLPDLIGENGLVADECAQALVAGREWIVRFTALKLSNLFRQASGKSKQPRKGQELTEGHEVNLVVARSPFSLRADERGGIKHLRTSAPVVRRRLNPD